LSRGATSPAASAVIDTSDIDRWIGVPLGGADLADPIHVNDIRRWAQGMQNPNPAFFDEDYAKAGRFGKIVAPQSFAVCTSDSHGAAPSIQGRIEGSHMLFGGDEWWFPGSRIVPGDRIRQERVLSGYDVKETKFAGPTVFSHGETTYVNERGETVAKQRCTSIRYLVAEAKQRGYWSANSPSEPEWTEEQLAEFDRRKFEYYGTFRDLGHSRRRGVTRGDKLPTRVIGPHTLLTFATEYRAFPMSVWGAFRPDGRPNSLRQAGWLPEMDKNMDLARIDPSQADGLFKGSSRGHAQPEYAKRIGLPRGYGYGASMGAWVLDYLGNWAGEWGEIEHAKILLRAPVFTGDVSFLEGEVMAFDEGTSLAEIEVVMTNQRDLVIAKATAEVRIPP
jgi:MaoC dehydratase-like protein